MAEQIVASLSLTRTSYALPKSPPPSGGGGATAPVRDSDVLRAACAATAPSRSADDSRSRSRRTVARLFRSPKTSLEPFERAAT